MRGLIFYYLEKAGEKGINHNYKRFDGETDEELIYRITGEKDLIGSWQQVADILNDLLGTEYTESKFRKQRQSFDKMLAAYSVKSSETTEELKAIQEERRELEKERVRLRDERNEYRKMIREEARKENYASMIKKLFKKKQNPLIFRFIIRFTILMWICYVI